MFAVKCKRCGFVTSSTAEVCKKCGRSLAGQVTKHAQVWTPEPVVAPEKTKKILTTVVPIAIVVLLLAFVVFYFSSGIH